MEKINFLNNSAKSKRIENQTYCFWVHSKLRNSRRPCLFCYNYYSSTNKVAITNALIAQNNGFNRKKHDRRTHFWAMGNAVLDEVSGIFVWAVFWFQQIRLLAMLWSFGDCVALILLGVGLLTLVPVNCSLL